jgi:hypothetical protein
MNHDVIRRDFLKLGSLGLLWGVGGLSLPGVLARRADAATRVDPLYDSVVQLFLDGGPSQTDTFDPKPGFAGNAFDTLSLGVKDSKGADVRVSKVLEELVRLVESDPRTFGLGIVRSVVVDTGDHGGAQQRFNCFTYGGVVDDIPSTASVMAHYLRDSVAGTHGVPSVVLPGNNGQAVNESKGSALPVGLVAPTGGSLADNPVSGVLGAPVGEARYARRRDLRDALSKLFARTHPDQVVRAHDEAVEQAYQMTLRGKAREAFDLAGETLLPAKDSRFAVRMTLAGRLVAKGIPYVALGMGGNDTHVNNRAGIEYVWKDNVAPALAAQARRIARDGKRCLVAIGGEFGRTPFLVANGDGRDHWTNGFSWAFLSINQPKFQSGAYGSTGADGQTVESPVRPGGIGGLLYRALGIDANANPIALANGKTQPPVWAYPTDSILERFGLAS